MKIISLVIIFLLLAQSFVFASSSERNAEYTRTVSTAAIHSSISPIILKNAEKLLREKGLIILDEWEASRSGFVLGVKEKISEEKEKEGWKKDCRFAILKWNGDMEVKCKVYQLGRFNQVLVDVEEKYLWSWEEISQ